MLREKLLQLGSTVDTPGSHGSVYYVVVVHMGHYSIVCCESESLYKRAWLPFFPFAQKYSTAMGATVLVGSSTYSLLGGGIGLLAAPAIVRPASTNLAISSWS